MTLPALDREQILRWPNKSLRQRLILGATAMLRYLRHGRASLRRVGFGNEHSEKALASTLGGTRIVDLQHIVTVDTLLFTAGKTLPDALQAFASLPGQTVREDVHRRGHVDDKHLRVTLSRFGQDGARAVGDDDVAALEPLVDGRGESIGQAMGLPMQREGPFANRPLEMSPVVLAQPCTPSIGLTHNLPERPLSMASHKLSSLVVPIRTL
ncbi:hypothetical protein [Microvirga sp. VF16]|uniref:hypothetical protein n=1 Tax=Microvirga sp. VF16 TaxID=2807101 RepID=UPI00193D2723|nr:hypothetical protein [Microvirga sp. VF16]QRM32783.1 hypothetical protein JO965_25755 [Microvirga sp. VF16]